VLQVKVLQADIYSSERAKVLTANNTLKVSKVEITYWQDFQNNI